MHVHPLLVALTIIRDATDTPAAELVPNPTPGKFITAELVGGNAPNLVTDSPLVVVQVWDKDPVDGQYQSWIDARALVDAFRTAKGSTVAGVRVRDFRLSALPYFFPDPDSGIARHQFSGELVLSARTIS